jgi:hypothetical protein
MFPVVLYIPIIVEDINTTCHKGKGNETNRQQGQVLQVKEFFCKKRWNEKEKILGPVFWSQQFNMIG